MPQLWNILIGVVLLLSLAMGGIAHAAEQICPPSIEATADSHMDGDTDQTPHGDEGYPHHHGGCHGHHNLVSFDDQAPEIERALSTEVVEFEAAFGAAAPPSFDLRPPIA